MDIQKSVKIRSTIFFALLLIAPGAVADVYYESVQVSQGVASQPDGEKPIKNYLSEHASRVEMEDGITITNYETGMIYQIDPQAKTYSEVNLANMGLPEMKGEESKALQGLMKKMMGGVTVTPTDETQDIAGYPCRKYIVRIMMMKSEFWVSNKVPGYDELRVTGKKMAEKLNQNPMMKQMNAAAMMTELDGFPVKTVMSMMKGTITTTLTKIEKKKLSGDLFTVPAGYQKK
jgi:hypothetical protein